jgi:hypothetical protein
MFVSLDSDSPIPYNNLPLVRHLRLSILKAVKTIQQNAAKRPSNQKESCLPQLDKPRIGVWLPELQTGVGSAQPPELESQRRFSSEELEGARNFDTIWPWEDIKFTGKPQADCRNFGSKSGGKPNAVVKQHYLSCIHKSLKRGDLMLDG